MTTSRNPPNPTKYPIVRHATERRLKYRYPIDLRIKYSRSPSSKHVPGIVRDISSGGVYFVSSEVLTPGTVIQLLIDWPISLHGSCAIQLKAQGRVLRSDAVGTAISFVRHGFLTRKAQVLEINRSDLNRIKSPISLPAVLSSAQ